LHLPRRALPLVGAAVALAVEQPAVEQIVARAPSASIIDVLGLHADDPQHEQHVRHNE